MPQDNPPQGNTPASPADTGWLIDPDSWRWLASRPARVGLMWLVAVSVGGQRLWHAHTGFDDPATKPAGQLRGDGNGGHAQIDFGGQWVMGRMLVKGYGRELYHRNRQWGVVRAAFPPAGEPADVREYAVVPPAARPSGSAFDLRHDAEQMMTWFMGDRDDPPEWRTVGSRVAAAVAPTNPLSTAVTAYAAERDVSPAVVAAVNRPVIGGPLYPPIQAFAFAPFALGDHPQRAYFVYQFVLAGFVVLAALGVKRLSGGRVWWSVATAVLFLYPGCRAALDLGQNPAVSLAILVWGWALAGRGREWAGGAVWGLLAFKPTWAVAFLLVPVLQRRWRFVLATAAVGGGLVLLTLPVVGVQTWFDWLAVGKEASATYEVNRNWNYLSRDLQGIPRRLLIDFDKPEAERTSPTIKALGWGLWGTVFVTTVAIGLWRVDRRRAIGVGAAFLFCGAYLTCYRFMYYDAFLSAAAVVVLLADPRRFARPTRVVPAAGGRPWVGYVNSLPLTLVVALGFVENSLDSAELRATFEVGRWARPTTAADGVTGMSTPRVSFDSTINYPWDTGLILALWAWCGIRLLLGEERPQPAVDGTPLNAASAAPTSADRISDSPTNTA